MARQLRARKDAGDKAAAAASAAAKAAEERRAEAEARAKATANVTDDTMVAAVLECGGLKTALETAQGAYRAALKKWEERGVDGGDVAWFLKTKKRDVQDVEAEIRRRNRLMRALAYPIGAQLGMFEDGESVGAKVDGDKIAAAKANGLPTVADLDAAKAQGYDAGLRGYGNDVDPFQANEGSPLSLAWRGGREAGTAEAARRAFGDGQAAEDMAGETVDGMRELRAGGAA